MKKFILIMAVAISLTFLTGCSLYQNEKPGNEVSNLNQNDKVIELRNQGLTKIPDEIFSNTDLEGLVVSDNEITGAIQAEIRHLKKLKVLNASNNLMTGVPAEIGQLDNLEVLDLSNNKLTGLPHELGNLKNLRILNLEGNNYSEQDLEIIENSLPETTEIIR